MKRLAGLSGFCAVSLLGLAAVPLFAAINLTGNWTTEVPTPEGFDIPVNLLLKQNGQLLTGSVAAPATPPLNIENGRVVGNKVSFTVSLNGIKVASEGIVDGDQIRLLSKPSDHTVFQDSQLVLKRTR